MPEPGSEPLLPFEAVWPTVAERLVPLGIETVPILDGAGRVLRADVRAAWDLPPASNSAMDGFALRAADTAEARPEAPVRLRIGSGDAYAGTRESPEVVPGTALRIATGGVLPAGADAVVPKERVEENDEEILLRSAVVPGANVRRSGEELRRGAVVATAGECLDPARIAAMAMAGTTRIEAGRRPRVAVVPTGDEITAIGEPVGPGSVVDTNAPFLRMSIERLLGTKVPAVAPVADEPDILRRDLGRALEGADVLVVTGGLSVGDRDHVKRVLEEDYGVERLFWRIALKPGKPTYAGRRGDQWVIGLPGNPATVVVVWHFLVRPLLLALMGAGQPEPRRFPVPLGVDTRPDSKRTVVRWCRFERSGDGLSVEPLERSGSHMLSDLARADALAILPTGKEILPAGTIVEAIDVHQE